VPTAQINGINLYYEEHGSGEPLLLIMGFTAHSMLWMMQTPVLAQQYRVIVFDNRGVGRSDVPPGPYTIRQMADDAAGLLDHLGIEQADVIGWSMGGMIAQELTLSYPRKVRRLVLLASLARAEAYAEAWLDFTVQSYNPEMSTAGRIISGMPWVNTTAFMIQPNMVQMALQQALADPFPATQAGVAAQAEACRAYIFGDALDRLSNIKAPTLVLVGAEDILTPPAYSRDMAERIPGARLQILDRGGHGVPIEYAQPVNEALLAFLAKEAVGSRQ
jgi:pimeloyl-ACP methyl ester carboxylesterase